MQLRRTYHFGETLKDIDLTLSARGHQPGFSELESWYNADAQAVVRAENGTLPKRTLAGWEQAGAVVSAYWADPSNLRRGIIPPDPDYTSGAHLTLQDGTDSLLVKPHPPKGRRRRSKGTDGLERQTSGSPRAAAAAAAAAAGVSGSPELEDSPEFDEGRRDSQAPPLDHAPTFPTLGYWLPPLSRPLTSVTLVPADAPLKNHGVLRAEVQERKDPQLPATWSLSPTPLTQRRKQRYTTHPETDPDTEYTDGLKSRDAKKKLSPFAIIEPDDIPQLKKAGGIIRGKNYRAAYQELNSLIEKYPTCARLYTLRAMCASKQGGNKAALKDAKKAVELDPSEIKAYCALPFPCRRVRLLASTCPVARLGL